MDLIKQTNIDFITSGRKIFTTSIIANIIGLLAIVFIGVDLGIDFTGGTEIRVRFEKKMASDDAVRSAMTKLGYGGAEIKSFGAPGDYLVRADVAGNATEVSAKIVAGLQQIFPADKVTLLGANNVEKKVSGELAWNSALAVLAAFTAILLFVTLRFEFVFGLGSIVALLHDVLMAFVISVLFNKLGLLNLELSINSIAAYLTIIGYSINDKVVVFDRIRENREKHKSMGMAELINLSLNETLSRTLITGVSVLAALLVMVFFGGDVLEGFAFTMFIGIVIGTYSSIYIATTFVLWFQARTGKKVATA